MINLLSDFLLLFYFILGCYIALMGHLHNTIGLGFARGVFSLEYWLRDCDCTTLQLAKYPPQKLYNAAFSNNKMVAWKPYLHSISIPLFLLHSGSRLQVLNNVQFRPDRWRMLAGQDPGCRILWIPSAAAAGCSGHRLTFAAVCTV